MSKFFKASADSPWWSRPIERSEASRLRLKAMDQEKAVGYVFKVHPAHPAADYEDADGHGRALPRRRKGETS